MTPEVVYVARHGETEGNVEGRWQGQLDSPLTARGRQQAHHMAALLADDPVDAIFSSPLGRAARTALVYADLRGLPVTLVDDLAEVDHGGMAGLTPEEMDRAFPGELARRARDKHRWRFPGGESYEDALPRAARALDVVAASGARKPLVVAHEMIGRLLLLHLRRVDVATALAGRHPHGVVYRVEYATGAVTALGGAGGLV